MSATIKEWLARKQFNQLLATGSPQGYDSLLLVLLEPKSRMVVNFDSHFLMDWLNAWAYQSAYRLVHGGVPLILLLSLAKRQKETWVLGVTNLQMA